MLAGPYPRGRVDAPRPRRRRPLARPCGLGGPAGGSRPAGDPAAAARGRRDRGADRRRGGGGGPDRERFTARRRRDLLGLPGDRAGRAAVRGSLGLRRADPSELGGTRRCCSDQCLPAVPAAPGVRRMSAVPGDTAHGPGRLIVAVYGVLALAATARSGVQIIRDLDRAPTAYLLSGLAAVVYLVATVALARG